MASVMIYHKGPMVTDRDIWVRKIIQNKNNQTHHYNTIEYWLRRLHGVEPEPSMQQSEAEQFEAMNSHRKPVCTDNEFYRWSMLLNQTVAVRHGVKNLFRRPRGY